MNNTSHGILQIENFFNHKKSAVIFHNQYILSHATILLNILDEKKYPSTIDGNLIYDLKECVENSKLIHVQTDEKFSQLKNINFELITCDAVFNKQKVKLLYILHCNNVSNIFIRMLKGFNVKFPEDINTTETNYQFLMSSFIFLTLNMNNSNDQNEILERLNVNTIYWPPHIDFNHFDISPKFTLNSKIIVKPINFNKFNSVISISTPFGNECFYRSINFGKIANIIGSSKSVMILTMPLVAGCEGAGVYNVNLDLIGIVVCTNFQWQNDNVTFTMAVNFQEIYFDLLNQLNGTRFCETKELMANNSVTDAYEKYVVMIKCGPSWGTGCMIKIGDKNMVITCSHVIENKSNIRCKWKNGEFSSNVIYRNTKSHQPFDIAILDVPENISIDYFSTLCKEKPTIGQEVIAIGFPLFSNLEPNKFSPSIFDGRITKYTKGMLLTDISIQAGQSGGPIFDLKGHLIGISVSNTKNQDFQMIYPNTNMSIPIYDIFNILELYAESGDINCLTDLSLTDDKIIRLWKLDSNWHLSKL